MVNEWMPLTFLSSDTAESIVNSAGRTTDDTEGGSSHLAITDAGFVGAFVTAKRSGFRFSSSSFKVSNLDKWGCVTSSCYNSN